MRVKVLYDVRASSDFCERGETHVCAYPLSEVADDGSLICLYRRGRQKHSYDGVLISQRSLDGGRTWSAPNTICDMLELDPPQSVQTGGACKASDGSLLAVFKATQVTEPDQYVYSQEGLTQACFIYTSRSTDGGETWSKPSRLQGLPTRQIGVTTKPLLLPNGSLLVFLETKPPGRVSKTIGAFSLDNGQTFGEFRDLGLTDSANQLEYCDARYTVIDESILALLWTFRMSDEETIAVHSSISTDGGRNWSRPEPTEIEGQIAAPLSIGDDIVMAASNYRNQPQGIRLWLSFDGGRTWPGPPIQMWDSLREQIIGEPVESDSKEKVKSEVWSALKDFTFGTPDLVALGDGTFVMTYYATVSDVTHVRSCRFELVSS